MADEFCPGMDRVFPESSLSPLLLLGRLLLHRKTERWDVAQSSAFLLAQPASDVWAVASHAFGALFMGGVWPGHLAGAA